MHRMLPVNAKTTKINEKTVSVDQMLGGENEETAVGVKPGGGAFQSVCIYNIEELVKVNGFPEHFIESSPTPQRTSKLWCSYLYFGPIITHQSVNIRPRRSHVRHHT